MANKPKIIWRSESFPKMIFTDQMLEVYKRAYPFVKLFQPELLKAVARLVSNPERVPDRYWGRFINNWMRIANQIAEEHKDKTPSDYREPSRRAGGNNKGELSLGEILNRARGHDSPKDAVAPGDTQGIIDSSVPSGNSTAGRDLFTQKLAYG